MIYEYENKNFNDISYVKDNLAVIITWSEGIICHPSVFLCIAEENIAIDENGKIISSKYCTFPLSVKTSLDEELEVSISENGILWLLPKDIFPAFQDAGRKYSKLYEIYKKNYRETLMKNDKI